MDHWTIVTVDGDCDLAAAPRLRQRLLEALERSGPFLVVDLSAATVVDSSALGVLASLLRRVAVRGGALRIVADASTRNLLGITGLDKVFGVYESVAIATAADARR